jgi:hypothetical protein
MQGESSEDGRKREPKRFFSFDVATPTAGGASAPQHASAGESCFSFDMKTSKSPASMAAAGSPSGGSLFGNLLSPTQYSTRTASPKVQQAAVASKNRRKKREAPRLQMLQLRGRSLSVTHNVSRITDQLYLGGSDISGNLEKLQKLAISHIVNCTSKLPNHFEQEISYLRLPVPDEPESQLDAFFETAGTFIEQAVRSGAVILVSYFLRAIC